MDVTIELVNGTIATITGFIKDADRTVTAMDIEVNGKSHRLRPITSKFEIITKIYVHRTQFPILLAYTP